MWGAPRPWRDSGSADCCRHSACALPMPPPPAGPLAASTFLLRVEARAKRARALRGGFLNSSSDSMNFAHFRCRDASYATRRKPNALISRMARGGRFFWGHRRFCVCLVFLAGGGRGEKNFPPFLGCVPSSGAFLPLPRFFFALRSGLSRIPRSPAFRPRTCDCRAGSS